MGARGTFRRSRLSRSVPGRPSEVELQRQLDIPFALAGGDLPEGRAVHVHDGRVEDRGVREVKRLCAEFDPFGFGNRKRFLQRYVQVPQAGAAYDADAGRAEGARYGLAEGRGVKPRCPVRPLVSRTIGKAVGPRSAGAGAGAIEGGDGQGEAGPAGKTL